MTAAPSVNYQVHNIRPSGRGWGPPAAPSTLATAAIYDRDSPPLPRTPQPQLRARHHGRSAGLPGILRAEQRAARTVHPGENIMIEHRSPLRKLRRLKWWFPDFLISLFSEHAFRRQKSLKYNLAIWSQQPKPISCNLYHITAKSFIGVPVISCDRK